MITTIKKLTLLTASLFFTTIAPLTYATNYADISLGPVLQQFHYNEPYKMHENGTMFGIQARQEDAYVLTELKVLVGELQYNGGIQDLTTNKVTPYKEKNIHFLFEGSGQLKYRLFSTASLGTDFLFGLGYRFWQDRESDFSGSYTRETTYLYMPLGLSLQQDFGDQHQVQARFNYQFFLGGKNKSYFKKFDDASLNFIQKEGRGIKLNLDYHYLDGSEKQFTASLFYSLWEISDSNIVFSGNAGYIEPQNITNEFGGVLSFYF